MNLPRSPSRPSQSRSSAHCRTLPHLRISAGNTSEPGSPFPASSSSPSQASHTTAFPTHISPRPGLLTFINKGFHRQRSVPHVEGVCGLGEDLTQPQRRLIIEMSEGSGGHLHHPNSGRRSLPRLGPKVGLLGIATLCWNLSFLYLSPVLNSGKEIVLSWALNSLLSSPLFPKQKLTQQCW